MPERILQWKEEYSIGEEEIDSQHKRLFEIAAGAFSIVSPSERAAKVKETIRRLVEYTRFHFDEEERFMKEELYPHLDTHKELHEEIIISMNAFMRRIPEMKIQELEKELAFSIQSWFIDHITQKDKQIQAWLQKKRRFEGLLEWNEEYALKYEPLDSAYKAILPETKEMILARGETPKQLLARLEQNLIQHYRDEEAYLQSKKILTPEHLLAHKKIIDILQNLIKKMRFNDQNMLERDLALFFQGYLTRHKHSLLMNQESLSTSL